MIQIVCMLVIFIVCQISALDWALKGHYADALAFGAFGLGYLGLALVFRSVQ